MAFITGEPPESETYRAVAMFLEMHMGHSRIAGKARQQWQSVIDELNARAVLERELEQGAVEVISRPTVVCLCGSTRFSAEFREARLRESLAGYIVLTLGSDTQTDAELGLSTEQIEALAGRHLHQIDMADEVLVINPGGYIGDHTRREIDYANEQHKVIRYLVAVS